MLPLDRALGRQPLVFPLRDLVAEGSDVWLYVAPFEQLDRSTFTATPSAKVKRSRTRGACCAPKRKGERISENSFL